MAEPTQPYRPRCKNLCCKSMMVYGEDFVNDPEFQAGVVEFWCLKTFQNLGPDDALLSLDACSNPERTCFEEF